MTAKYNPLKKLLDTTLDAFDGLGTFEQASFLTLPLLLLYVEDHWYVKIPVIGLTLAGLLFFTLRGNPFYWFALACFMAAGIYYNWEAADNHKYLMTYWCLALFFIIASGAGEEALKNSARYLIGLAFAFAVVWKFVTPDFMNGDFFEYTFIFDERFNGKLEIFGILQKDSNAYNQLAQEALIAYDSQLAQVDIAMNHALTPWAKTLAWWTILLEGLIAAFFLSPRRPKRAIAGNLLLICFLLSTYLIAPVIGFGWIIATMGFVQCDAKWRTIRLGYIVSILLLQAYRLPWATLASAFAN